jgi:hypothetical protein
MKEILMKYMGGAKYPGPCRNCSRYCGCDTLRLFRDDRYKAAKWVTICTDCCEDWDARFNKPKVIVAPQPAPVKEVKVVEVAKPKQLSLFG